MKAVRLFSFCFLCMVVSVHTKDDAVDQKLNETIRRGVEDSARYYEVNPLQDAMTESIAESSKTDRQLTSGLTGRANRIDLWPPPSQTRPGSNANSWQDANFDVLSPKSKSTLDELFQQQNSISRDQSIIQSNPLLQSNFDWSSFLNPSSDQKFQPAVCKNGETLKRIISSILMLLLQPVENNNYSPNLLKITGVLNTIEFQIQSDGLQNMNLYPKLLSLENTLRTGSYPNFNNMFESKPKLGSPDCDAAFLKLVVLAYTLYKQLSKYPDCNHCPFSNGNYYWNNPQKDNSPPHENSQTYPYQNLKKELHLYSNVYPYPDPKTNSFPNLQTGPSPDLQTNPFQNSQKSFYPKYQPDPILNLQIDFSPGPQMHTFQIGHGQKNPSQTSPFLNSQNNPYQYSQTNSFVNPQISAPLDTHSYIFQNPQTAPSTDSQANNLLNPQSFSSQNSQTNNFLNPQTVPSEDSQTSPLQSPQNFPATDTPTNPQTSPSPDSYPNSEIYSNQNSLAPNLQINSNSATRTSAYPDLNLRPQLAPYPKPQTYPYQNPQNYLSPTQQTYSYPGYQSYSNQEQNKPYDNYSPKEEEFGTFLRNYVKPLANDKLLNQPNGKVNAVKILSPDTQKYLHVLGTGDSPAKNSQDILEKLLRSSSPIVNNYPNNFLQNMDLRVKKSLLPKIDESEQKSSAEEKFDQSLKHAAELVRSLKDGQQQPPLLKPTSDIKETETIRPPALVQLYSRIGKKNEPSSILLPYRTQVQNLKLQSVPQLKLISVSQPRIERPIREISYQRLNPYSMSLSNTREPVESQSLSKQMPNQIYTYILNRLQPTDLRNTLQLAQLKSQQDHLNSLHYPQSNTWQTLSMPSHSNQYPLLPVSTVVRKPLGQNEPVVQAPSTLLRQGYNPTMSYNIPFKKIDQPNSNPVKQNDLLQLYPKHFDNKEILGPCLHNLCNQILATDHQPNVINIFLSSPCKGISESQKLFLVQLLQQFRIPPTGDKTSNHNLELLKRILEYLKPDSDNPPLPGENITELNTDDSKIDVSFYSYIIQLIKSSLPNAEDQQIALNLVEDTTRKLKEQGIDFNKKENLILLLAFARNIISQLLIQANTPPILDTANPFKLIIPDASPEFIKYLHEMLIKRVENVQERQIIISRLLDYMYNLKNHGYDFKKQETMNLVIAYLDQQVSQKSRLAITPPTPAESMTIPDENSNPPSGTVNSKLLELVYELILSSVPVSQTQVILTEVKMYIDQLINQGIDLNTSENFELLLNYVKKLISQIQTEPTTNQPTNLPTVVPTPPTQQVNPEFLKKLYEFITSSVETEEQKQFILEQLQIYIKELIKKGVDMNKTENLNFIDAFVRQMIDNIMKSQTELPSVSIIPTSLPTGEFSTVNRDILYYAYDIIRNFISNPQQEQVAIQYFHEFLKLATENNFDLNNKENIYKAIISIIDIIKEDSTSTSLQDIDHLSLAPKSVEVTYILNTKLKYGRSGVVKYIVPFETFINNIRDILLRTPLLRSQSKLEGVLRSASNITEVSPELQEVPIDRLINLISRNGSFIDAEIPRDDIIKRSKNANDLKALKEFKEMVFKLDEKVNNNNRGTVETMDIISSLNNPLVKRPNTTKQYSLSLTQSTNLVNSPRFRRTDNEITTAVVTESINRNYVKAQPIDYNRGDSKLINNTQKEAGLFENNITIVSKPINPDHRDESLSKDNINIVSEPINRDHKLHEDVSLSDDKIIAASKVINGDHLEALSSKENNTTIVSASTSDTNLIDYRHGNTENVTESNTESI